MNSYLLLRHLKRSGQYCFKHGVKRDRLSGVAHITLSKDEGDLHLEVTVTLLLGLVEGDQLC